VSLRLAGLAWAATLIGLTGCAAAPRPVARASTAVLARADQALQRAEYASAVKAYDDFLARYPHDQAAPRARASRETVALMLAGRAELEQLHQDLARREGELARLREAVAERESELARRDAEATKREEELAQRDGELAQRDGELARRQQELARRDAELGRARQELGRLAAEADRLRADIERLKEADLRLERRR
jgi:chromosome segregation ATPase